jgi:hypothetical protein
LTLSGLFWASWDLYFACLSTFRKLDRSPHNILHPVKKLAQENTGLTIFQIIGPYCLPGKALSLFFYFYEKTVFNQTYLIDSLTIGTTILTNTDTLFRVSDLSCKKKVYELSTTYSILLYNAHMHKANLSGSVMDTVTKSVTSAFQHDCWGIQENPSPSKR